MKNETAKVGNNEARKLIRAALRAIAGEFGNDAGLAIVNDKVYVSDRVRVKKIDQSNGCVLEGFYEWNSDGNGGGTE